ncbi:MAG: hypothetical protein IK073_00200 [Paludibacteraceae bacterium]|nr:hypothetical protein [Paludibacteraceae bacterium]
MRKINFLLFLLPVVLCVSCGGPVETAKPESDTIVGRNVVIMDQDRGQTLVFYNGYDSIGIYQQPGDSLPIMRLPVGRVYHVIVRNIEDGWCILDSLQGDQLSLTIGKYMRMQDIVSPTRILTSQMIYGDNALTQPLSEGTRAMYDILIGDSISNFIQPLRTDKPLALYAHPRARRAQTKLALEGYQWHAVLGDADQGWFRLVSLRLMDEYGYSIEVPLPAFADSTQTDYYIQSSALLEAEIPACVEINLYSKPDKSSRPVFHEAARSNADAESCKDATVVQIRQKQGGWVQMRCHGRTGWGEEFLVDYNPFGDL